LLESCKNQVVGAEIGDGLEVRLQRPQQPHDLDVAVAFGFQPAARPHPVEISVDVELEQIARRVARPAGRLCLDAREARLDEIEAIDDGIDEADGVVGADVVVHRFWQKKKLVAFEAGNVRHARF